MSDLLADYQKQEEKGILDALEGYTIRGFRFNDEGFPEFKLEKRGFPDLYMEISMDAEGNGPGEFFINSEPS